MVYSSNNVVVSGIQLHLLLHVSVLFFSLPLLFNFPFSPFFGQGVFDSCTQPDLGMIAYVNS